MSTHTNERTVVRREGRLLDPAASMLTDPRIDPRLRRQLVEFGLADNSPSPQLSRHGSRADIVALTREAHDAFNGLYEAMPNDLPGDVTVGYTTHQVTGVDGNSIAIRVYRTAQSDHPAPCVIYFHGGGMTVLEAFGKVHDRWSQDLAATGLVSVLAQFRNAWTPEGLHPFPAGLNDCLAVARWVSERRRELGISKVILQGESGGGNLALSTALKALREGGIGIIDGVYACVPYISGAYAWSEDRKLAELPSLIENDGYILNMAQSDLVSELYNPGDAQANNPLCWPGVAHPLDLAGLPPHVITVNELDPLRDEGVAYYRRLLEAGVRARARVNLGMAHAAEMIFRKSLPDIYFATIADIAHFARKEC